MYMKPKVLITGGTGLVGGRLSDLLSQKGYEVSHLSRNPKGNEKYTTFRWEVTNKHIDEEALQVDHIIHLAGAGVADSRWSKERKQEIYNSRIDSTNLLFEKIKSKNIPLTSFICASAIGYYGLDTGDQLLDEEKSPGHDFLAEVVKDWEKAANQFESLDVEVSKVRIGVVLAEKGGALPKIMAPIQKYVGAPLGSGQQYMSWIHIEDLCQIFSWILDGEEKGTFNAVAPNPLTNAAITRAIAKELKKPLILPPVPSFVLKLMLGEMSGIVLGGNNVSSKKLVDLGFKFQFVKATDAISDLVGEK